MPDENKNSITPPIQHSLAKDTGQVSTEIVSNPAVSIEEAKMLVTIQSTSSKKRQTNLLDAMAIFILIAATILFAVPMIFSTKEKDSTIQIKNEKKELLNYDAAYMLPVPAEKDFPEFRKKIFKSDAAIAKLELQKDGSGVTFEMLPPFVGEKFIKSQESITDGQYFYGLYTGEDKISHPFFVLSVGNNRALAEESLLKEEKNLYNDLGVVLQLPEDSTIGAKNFGASMGVRNPLREILNDKQEDALVYGFATDELVIFTSSRKVYGMVKSRILSGY